MILLTKKWQQKVFSFQVIMPLLLMQNDFVNQTPLQINESDIYCYIKFVCFQLKSIIISAVKVYLLGTIKKIIFRPVLYRNQTKSKTK
jgi:hypothetical protein